MPTGAMNEWEGQRTGRRNVFRHTHGLTVRATSWTALFPSVRSLGSPLVIFVGTFVCWSIRHHRDWSARTSLTCLGLLICPTLRTLSMQSRLIAECPLGESPW